MSKILNDNSQSWTKAPFENQHKKSAQRAALETRQKLASTSGTNISYDKELFAEYIDTKSSAIFIIPIMVIIVAAFSSIWIDYIFVLLFVSLIIISNTLVVFTCSKYRKTDKNRANLRQWTNRVVFLEAIYGFSWACLGLFSFLGSGDNLTIIMFAIFLIGIATNAFFTRSLPNATLASTMPATIAVSLSLIITGTMLNYTLAILVFGAEIFFLFLARQLHRSELVALEHRAEKDSLIAELKEAQNMSDEARRHAEQSNIAKSSFLATMSHELRTPLNAIIGFSEVLKSELLGPHQVPQYKEYAADICSSGQHLLTLINELLDLSRIEAGKYELSESAINLVDIARDCHRMLEIKAKSKSIEYQFFYEENLPSLWADERAVRQVILNLLSNAIKFTPQSGKVEISVKLSNDGAQLISVKDNGPGIPEDEIPTVLSSFGQGSLAHKTAEAGAGLGLPIVKNIMEMHQGRFDLFSKLRFGTETIATFPSARTLKGQAAVIKRRNRLEIYSETG